MYARDHGFKGKVVNYLREVSVAPGTWARMAHDLKAPVAGNMVEIESDRTKYRREHTS